MKEERIGENGNLGRERSSSQICGGEKGRDGVGPIKGGEN